MHDYQTQNFGAVKEEVADKKVILVVDDELGWRELLSSELSLEGYAVISADCALAALDLLGRNRVDVIVTDVRMPGKMDGIDLINTYCPQGKVPPRVVYMTGYASEEKLLDALERHKPSHCFKKPFDVADLIKVISSIFNQ